jgi:hypothetical protein
MVGWGKATTAYPRPGTLSQPVCLVRSKHADHEEPQQHVSPPLSVEDTLSRSTKKLLEAAPFLTVSGPKEGKTGKHQHFQHLSEEGGQL